MNPFFNNILFTTYRRIKNELPSFVYSATIKLTPLFLLSSIFEIIGLSIMIPVINLLIDPSKIQSNKYSIYIFNLGGFTNNVSFVLFLFITIGVIFIIKNSLLFFIIRYQTATGFKIASSLATNKYNAYLKMPYLFFAENNSAILLRNTVQLPIDMVIYLIIPFIGLLNEVFLVGIIVIAMTWYSPLLFFATLIFVFPFLLFYNRIYKSRLKELSASRDEGSSNIYKIGLQSIEGHREIKVFDKLDYFKPLFKKTMNSYTKGLSAEYLLNAFSPKLVETVAILCLVNIFLFGYIFGKNIQALTQFMAIFAIASYRIIPSVNKIILYSNYIKSSSYIFNYFSKDDEEKNPQNTNTQTNQDTALSFKNRISIKNLSFRFKGHTENTLHGINLEINKGDSIGIVGPSGSGKTTLLNILLRLIEETEGGIYLDDKKISYKNIKEWYKLVSYVPQQMTLLDASIKENIAFGIQKDEINTTLLQKAIERSQLLQFIESLPNGVDTNVGEKGINISGGQKQRIAIARALYHGGEILIFDEATSALDTETEEMLTESIHSISHQDLTIIVVSHRHQTLKYCDSIYRLENGTIRNPIKYAQLIG